MSDPFIGEIKLFALGFAPRGWALCSGQLLPIAQNQALFSILGTTYGGNGTTTFALPDLRGRAPVGWGQGPGLPYVQLGERAGQEATSLLSSQMPAHSHGVLGDAESATSGTPAGNTWAANDLAPYSSASNTAMNPAAIGPAGGSQPHNNLQPYLALNYVIALVGIFPTRS